MSRLLRPAARCPRCGKPPRLRITEAERELALSQAPHVLKQTIQCTCGRVYELTAAAFHDAA